LFDEIGIVTRKSLHGTAVRNHVRTAIHVTANAHLEDSPMKSRLIFSFCILVTMTLHAQTVKEDPLKDYGHFREAKQLAVIPLYPSSPMKQEFFDYLHLPGFTDSLMAGPSYQFPDSLPRISEWEGALDQVAGNFGGDRLDEIAVAWRTADNSLAIAIMDVDEGTHYRSIVALWKIDASAVYWSPDAYTHHRSIRLLAGQFDHDSEEELLLAYVAADSTAALVLYDSENGFTFTPRSSLQEQKISVHLPWNEFQYGTRAEVLDVAVTDLDQDGINDIVLAGYEPDGLTGWSFFVKSYKVDGSSMAMSPKGKDILFRSSDLAAGYTPFHVSMISGDFSTKEAPECLVQWSTGDTLSLYGGSYTAMQMVRFSSDLLSAERGPRRQLQSLPLMASGDLDGDGTDEIVLAYRDSMLVCRGDSSLDLTRLSKTTPSRLADEYASYFMGVDGRSLVVADINSDSTSGWLPDIVIAEMGWYQWDNRARAVIYESVLDTAGAYVGLQATKSSPIPYWEYFAAQTAGNFDGKDVWLGLPKVFSKTAIIQPLVILNAPPIHFDVIGGTSYDVCKMYGGDPHNFVATYEKESSSTFEIETKISKSWSRSISLGAGGSIFGINIGASLTKRVGESFSKETGSSNTITIGVHVDAIDDDVIYATVAQYDIWEYPAYSGDNLIGQVLVLDPNSATIQHGWFASKDWAASSYVPNHEVGNILSYRRYAELNDNPDLSALIKGSNNVFFALNATSSPEWYLKFSDFQSQSVTTTKTANLDIGGSISGWGISVGVSGSYSSESVWTHRTQAMSDLSLHVRLGSVNMGIGEVAYEVTPYSYWGKNGALILDYAVKPALADPGYTPTWWQDHYNKPDPSFILPWRYDPEKGYALTDPAKRNQTKDITIQPSDAERGDTVLITARVRNFGLVNTDAPIPVRFYVGDPDAGGTPIVGTDGAVEVLTDGIVPARGIKTVQLRWRIPMDLPQLPRIYALISPESVLDELQTNNNKGFTVLGVSTIPSDVHDPGGMPVTPSLEQNYPNPFNPTTTIDYYLPSSSHVALRVYNLIGQEVAVLADGQQEAGLHSVRFDGRGLATGVYFYRLMAGGFVKVQRMIMLK
jgi:hypothetical protein